MVDFENLQSSNINSKWLENIYENIKNLEKMCRIAENGFEDINYYITSTQQEKQILLPELQFTNLKSIITELDLLLDDLTPIIEEGFINECHKELSIKKREIKDRNDYIYDVYNPMKKNILVYRELKTKFYSDLDSLSLMKRKIISKIGPILYVKADSKPKGMDKNDKEDIIR